MFQMYFSMALSSDLPEVINIMCIQMCCESGQDFSNIN